MLEVVEMIVDPFGGKKVIGLQLHDRQDKLTSMAKNLFHD
jgi:hypothetical protein